MYVFLFSWISNYILSFLTVKTTFEESTCHTSTPKRPRKKPKCKNLQGFHITYLSHYPPKNLPSSRANEGKNIFLKKVVYDETPLHEAGLNGHQEICQKIIENIIDKNPEDNEGITPLHLAVKNGRVLEFVNWY